MCAAVVLQCYHLVLYDATCCSPWYTCTAVPPGREGMAKAWYLDVFDKYGQTPVAAAAEMGLYDHARC